jgi:hypothetical protein
MPSTKGYNTKGLKDFEKLLETKKREFKQFTNKRKVKAPKNIFTDAFT